MFRFQTKKQNTMRISRALGRCLALWWLLCAAGFAHQYLPISGPSRFFASVILFAIGAWLGKAFLKRMRDVKWVWPDGDLQCALIILTTALGIGFILLWLLPVEPVSDFETYYQYAVRLAKGEEAQWSDYIRSVAPSVLAYSNALSFWLRITDCTVDAARVFSVICFSGCAAFFFLWVRKMTDRQTAFWSAMLTVLMPEMLLYAQYIAVEPLCLLLCFGGACLLWTNPRSQTAFLRAALSGAMFSFAQSVRPVAILFLIVRMVDATRLPREVRARGWAQLGLALAVFGAGQYAYGLWEAAQLGIAPVALPGWALYEGLDLQGFGQWNEGCANTLMNTISAFPPERVQGEMLRLTIEKINGYGLADWARLLLYKGGTLWYGGGFVSLGLAAPAWLRVTMEAAAGCTNALLLLAGSSALWQRRDEDAPIGSYMLAVGLLALIHCFITAIPRYRLIAIPLIWLLVVSTAIRTPAFARDCPKTQ